MRAAWAAAAVLALGACGSAATPSPAPSLLIRGATAYLLTLDQLRTPGFTVVDAPQSIDASAVGGGDATLQGALGGAGVRDVAMARYFRAVPELATANGPVDVRTTVLRCATASGAHSAFAALARHTDAVPGMTAESAGALGDEAHADELHTTAQGVALVEVSVIWRTANLVSMLDVRGRDGGTGLSDALILAHAEATGER